MVKKVFKYEMPLANRIVLTLPKGAEILSVQAQYDKPCLWALVDPNAPLEKRTFRFAGTGHPIKSGSLLNYKFIDTFQMGGGSLVFHIFEMIMKED